MTRGRSEGSNTLKLFGMMAFVLLEADHGQAERVPRSTTDISPTTGKHTVKDTTSFLSFYAHTQAHPSTDTDALCRSADNNMAY